MPKHRRPERTTCRKIKQNNTRSHPALRGRRITAITVLHEVSGNLPDIGPAKTYNSGMLPHYRPSRMDLFHRIRRRLAVAAVACICGCSGPDGASADPARADNAASNGRAVPQLVVHDPPASNQALNVEKVYYKQFRLIGLAARALANQRPGIPDLYFVGFAGDASQDVFLREMRSVRTLFDDRFDTQNRSIMLINNAATVETIPLANTHNLLAALDQVATRMDREEDVLFLFLTTHGTPGILAVNFDPLQLNDLTAPDLRSLLDRAEIKWRVIVVSACYSGSFIDTLKDENTLIVTAARKDRVSFGCSHENDFTYFGRAYFDMALRGTYSFIDAFGAARKTVNTWEVEEDLTPSLPQIFVGNAIRSKLAEIEQRLRLLHPAN